MKTVGKIVLAGVILLVLVVGGCVALVGGVANEVDKEMKKDAATVTEVTYEVETSANANASNITYTSNADADISQANDKPTPWSKTVKIKGDPSFAIYSLTAQNSAASGSITCRILVDGEVVKKNTSQGGYAVVTCNYTEK